MSDFYRSDVAPAMSTLGNRWVATPQELRVTREFFASSSLLKNTGGWVTVRLHQQPGAVNTWLKLPRSMRVLGWSGYPVVIGPPSAPEAIAGAMWYKSNLEDRLGGAASTAMLKHQLEHIHFADHLNKR